MFIESDYYFNRHGYGSALELTRPQTMEYFGPIISDVWKDGIGFIGSPNSILKPIKYLAPNCEVLLASSHPKLGPNVQGYWCLSASSLPFKAAWISPVSMTWKLLCAVTCLGSGCSLGKLLGCWKVISGPRASPEWVCLLVVQKAGFSFVTLESLSEYGCPAIVSGHRRGTKPQTPSECQKMCLSKISYFMFITGCVKSLWL